MKKNYFSKIATLANPLVTSVAEKTWKNMTTAWLLALFTLLGFSDAFGAVVITRADGTVNSCKLPTDYTTLGNIVITEAAKGDFAMLSGTSYT